MHQLGESSFQVIGDIGEILSTDLFTSPIRRLINRDAERAGIDLHNPYRSVASLLGSCSMGAALGVVLGPPGGILGGILGYVVAIGSDFDGDQSKSARDMEEASIYLLELKALQIAVEAIQDYADAETWAEICDEVEYEIDILSVMHDPSLESLDNALELMLGAVSEGIRRVVDFEFYSVFILVYEEARREFDL